jgi:HPr kinase/phosphorylase
MTNVIQNIYATCVVYQDVGLLICGQSGSGKSSLALSLIEKGAYLVSDDQTVLFEKNGVLHAKAPSLLFDLMEVRHIGLVSGWPTKNETPIHCVIHLCETEPNRLPLTVKERLCGHDLMSFSFYKYDLALTNKINTVIQIVKNKLILKSI